MSKPLVFRIYPEHRSLYFRVNIWSDYGSMVRRSRAMHGRLRGDRKTRAFHTPVRVTMVHDDGRRRLCPLVGELNFHRADIGAGLVAHEMTHAALEWARRIGVNVEDTGEDARIIGGGEERFCEVLGNLVNQFYVHAQRLKLY